MRGQVESTISKTMTVSVEIHTDEMKSTSGVQKSDELCVCVGLCRCLYECGERVPGYQGHFH